MENMINFNDVPTQRVIFWGVLYGVIFIALYFILNTKKVNELPKVENKAFVFIALAVISIMGVFLRIFLASKFQPHSDVINFFIPWTKQLENGSLFDFYFVENSTTINPNNNYTPMYVYILFICAKIIKLFGLSQIGQIIVLKLPAIIADLIAAIFIYKIAKKLNQNEKLSIFFFTMYLFSPAAIINSGIWGQVDGITSMFTLITLYLIIAKKDILAIFFAFVGVCFKLQFIFAFPAIGMYFLIKAVKNKKLFLDYFLAVIYGVAFFAALSLPVMIRPMMNGNPFFPITIYLNQVSIYNYYTLNAFNLYGVLGLNFVEIQSSSISAVVSIATVLISCLYVVFFSIKNNSEKNVAVLIAVTIGFVFTFTMKMHERYMFVIMAVVMCQLTSKKDKVLPLIYALISIVVYLNIALIMNFPGYCFYYAKSEQMLYGGISELVSFALLFIYSTIYLIKDLKNKNLPIECMDNASKVPFDNSGNTTFSPDSLENTTATPDNSCNTTVAPDNSGNTASENKKAE